MTAKTELEIVTAAAKAKFGELLSAVKKNGAWALGIKRDQPVFEDKPFMTIKARVSNGVVKYPNTVEFYWGSYDLSEADMTADLATR